MSKFKKELEAEKELAMIKGESWEDYYSDLDIPEGWENVSYGNDALPSFLSVTKENWEDEKAYHIWIDSHDPEIRKQNSLDIFGVEYSPRFCVTMGYGYGPTPNPNSEFGLFSSDDWNEVVEWINNNPKTPEQIEETKKYI